MKIYIVHFNTPLLTECAIRSLRKHSKECEVVVFDNSDRHPFQKMNGVEILDNTQSQMIEFDKLLNDYPNRLPSNNNYASFKHCYTVQWIISRETSPFILMDSDVLIRQDIKALCRPDMAFAGQIAPHIGYHTTIDRVLPFLCYVNAPMINDAGVTYFDSEHMWAVSPKMPNCAYDTGCWFLEDCKQNNLPYANIDIDPYMLHFGHGSWKGKSSEQWLLDNRGLWL